jgi:hypothetical protein
MAGEPVIVTNYSDFREIEIKSIFGEKMWLPINANFCMYAAPRITAVGDTFWHTAATTAAFALLFFGIYEQLRIFNMRYEIAKGYADISTEQWVRFVQRYQPLEALMVAESLADKPRVPDYAAAETRGRAFAADAWDTAETDMARWRAVYRICPGCRDRTWGVARRLGEDDLVNFVFREEESTARTNDDLRWNQRSNLLNIGRGTAAMGAQYASAANELLRPLAAGAAALTNGAFQTIGYLYDRNMLSFPAFFTQSTSPGQITGMETKELTKTGKE